MSEETTEEPKLTPEEIRAVQGKALLGVLLNMKATAEHELQNLAIELVRRRRMLESPRKKYWVMMARRDRARHRQDRLLNALGLEERKELELKGRIANIEETIADTMKRLAEGKEFVVDGATLAGK